jgi:cytochrome c-type biogenesis protein
VLGMALIVIGLSIVSGIDKALETLLVDASPQWLTRLTTAF